MILDAKETQPVSRWNSILHVFSGAADAAKNVFNFEEDENEFSLEIKPGLIHSFSREIRMLQSAFGIPEEQSPAQKQLLQFAYRKIAEATSSTNKNPESSIHLTKELIGKMIFLSDRNMPGLEEIVQMNDPSHYPPLFEEFFHRHLQIYSYQLQVNDATENIAQLQLNRKNQTSNSHVQIAKLVVTSTGIINLAIAEDVIKVLRRPSEEGAYRCEDLLFDLVHVEQLYDAFDTITSPSEGSSPVYDLIRCILKERSNVDVSSSMAKQAVLSALMDRFVDCKFGDLARFRSEIHGVLCFCNILMRTGKGMVLQDLYNEEEDLNETFLLQRDGMLNDSVPLWDLPGIAAVARQLGINNLSHVWGEFTQQLFATDSQRATISLKDFIRRLVSYALNKNHGIEDSEDQLIALGVLAFYSTQSNPLINIIKHFMKREKARLNKIVSEVALYRILDKTPSVNLHIQKSIEEDHKQLVEASYTVSRTIINENMGLNIFEFAYVNMIPSDSKTKKLFDQTIKEYNAIVAEKSAFQPVTIKEYAEKILDTVRGFMNCNEWERHKNERALSCYLLTKGLEDKFRNFLWENAIKIELKHSVYQSLKLDFYLIHDFLSDQLVTVSVNKDRTKVEILEHIDWNDVLMSI